ncbi:MAG: glycosyltransferase family 2 protein [Ignavibacteriales bacterium]|nr:glycosyltransferase family 2 protein [Ignavibacteriales bacterium]
MHFLSIIIVTHNSAEVIVECLRSIFTPEQTHVPFEVIAIDNASRDETVVRIRAAFPNVVLLENKVNVGFGAAVNQGFARSRGKIVLFLNPDTVLQNNLLNDLVSFFETHPVAAIVGPKVVDQLGLHHPSCWKTPSLMTVACESFLPYRLSLALTTTCPSQTEEVPMVSGACLAVRREVFERLKGFDERFFLYYEDADFCLRARLLGYHIYFFPAATVIHRVHQSYNGDLRKFFLYVYTSKIIFFRKHSSRTIARIVRWFIVCGVLLRIPIYALFGVLTLNKELLRLSKYHTFVLPKLLRMES